MRGDGKGDSKGETQRGEKSAHHAVRHGVLFSLMGFPLRKENPKRSFAPQILIWHRKTDFVEIRGRFF